MPWHYGDRNTFYFMVRDHKPHFFYFEIVEFARKLVLTGFLMSGVATCERTHDDFNNGARYKLKPILPVLLSPVYLCIARLALELHSLLQAKAVLLLGPAIFAGWDLAAVRLLLVLCTSN